MPTIRTHCSECQEDVDINQQAVRVDIYPNREACTYTFTCPNCGKLAVKPAVGETLRLLEAAIWADWKYHSPPPEAAEPKTGPALTHDDVIDFIIDMNRTPDHLIPILAGGER